jgi:hypothetical protein
VKKDYSKIGFFSHFHNITPKKKRKTAEKEKTAVSSRVFPLIASIPTFNVSASQIRSS